MPIFTLTAARARLAAAETTATDASSMLSRGAKRTHCKGSPMRPPQPGQRYRLKIGALRQSLATGPLCSASEAPLMSSLADAERLAA